jgi:DNA-binding transcriptional MerR regulator
MGPYRVGEFAVLTGVSVRTLHHYDRIGLLKPSARSAAGYRLYRAEDTLRLQQILTLRYLGFPLLRIRELLDGPDFDLLTSVGIQRTVLRERMAELGRIEHALEALMRHREQTGAWDWSLAAGVTAAAQEGLTAKGELMNEYYTPEQMAQEFENMGKEMDPGEQERITQEWPRLLAAVRQSYDLDPADPVALELLRRWDELVSSTFRGNDKLASSVAQGYREGRYAEIEGTPTPEDFAFLQRVREAATG